MSIAFISHPDCLRHDMGAGHPERPARLTAITARLQASGLMQQLLRLEAPPASDAQLARVHDPRYIAAIRASAPGAGLVRLDPDTAMNPYSLSAALRASGAAVRGVDAVMAGEADSAFCAVRPPGHHAESARAMGFCIFNNVAVGAAHALAAHGLARVAIADFDVHHGNGTEQIFHDDARVMLCSTFQHPYYPYRGADSGNDHIINVPLPAGTASTGFRDAVTQHWLPALETFRPELLLFSAGFDAHRDDAMAGLALVEDDYAWVTRQVRAVADKHAQGRMVSLLEGGYALDALARSVEAHLQALL